MGLRERKKEKTRLALLDAALDLFLEQGYDATTVEQIAGAVDISPRTFFRYFPTKDHVPLWFHEQGEETMQEALDSRPADEPAFTAMVHALRAVIQDMQGTTPEDTERFLKLRKVFDANPALVGKSVARGTATERRLTEVIAGRRGVDPADPLSALIVAWAMATMRVGFECPVEPVDLPSMVSRMEQVLELAERSLRPGWDA
ncbi:TetR family transcriptional regulator [Nonomuraea typhae]|uniref:TetR family transcriptional regulator n=1 Tax=Nonomuraea typhae TaxID=2603600 RepID=UPI0015E21417|nr:TetR family transcriptional regulator [Nonomuraea typhae]